MALLARLTHALVLIATLVASMPAGTASRGAMHPTVEAPISARSPAESPQRSSGIEIARVLFLSDSHEVGARIAAAQVVLAVHDHRAGLGPARGHHRLIERPPTV